MRGSGVLAANMQDLLSSRNWDAKHSAVRVPQ
jgi:hypothetical protein